MKFDNCSKGMLMLTCYGMFAPEATKDLISQGLKKVARRRRQLVSTVSTLSQKHLR